MDSNYAFIYGNGGANEQVDLSTGDTDYIIDDAMGSARALVDSAGSVSSSTSYDMWGNPVGSASMTAQTPQGFAGGLDSALGINRFGLIDFDPQSVQTLPNPRRQGRC